MAKNRMAGEELDKDNPVAAEAKEAISQSERNKQIRTEIAASPERAEERMSGIDREKYDLEGYSDKDIVMSFKGGEFGDKDYARLTGDLGGEDTPETPVKPPADTAPPEVGTPLPERDPFVPAPTTPTPISVIGSGQTVIQDNDLNSTVTGDGNNVDINQDNSVRQKQNTLGATNLMDNYVLNLRKSKGTI